MADIDLLMAFHRQLNLDDPALVPRPFSEGALRAALAMLLQDPSLGQIWLISLSGESIGYLVITFGFSLEYGGRDAFVDELFIRADYRGRGIGSMALQWAQDVCRRLDVRALHLEVERANARAHRLYRYRGFEDRGRYLLTRRLDP